MEYNERHRKNRFGKQQKHQKRSDANGKKSHSKDRHENFEAKPIFHPKIIPENVEEIAKKNQAIRELKNRIIVCGICGKPILDIESAINERGSEKPAHFDCVLEKISSQEKLLQNEKISYIGSGKFAVLYFENPHNQKKFVIRRTIEWENSQSDRTWRNEFSALFSQIN